MILKPCEAEIIINKERDSIKSNEEAAVEPMEEVSSSSSSVVNSCLTKRKAEFDPEEEEEEEEEEISDEKPKTERVPVLQAPEWDVDSFDGLEYVSSSEMDILSSDKMSDDDEVMASYRFIKRQLIESKGFYIDPSHKLRCLYKGIKPMGLERMALPDKTFCDYWEDMVHVCIQKYNQENKDSPPLEFVQIVRGHYRGGARSRSYITFMAREKPGELPVEYQAKCMSTLDGKRHPILCRPAPPPPPPTPNPSDQNS
ncbi:unnamed protein product [Cochlearia groenlandica]